MTATMEPTEHGEQARIASDETAKDPFTRLLDLTLGWGEYVERDEAEHGDGVKSAEIYSLYQSVAKFADPYWDAAPEVQETAARQFVESRLLPLLMGKKQP